MAVATKAIGDVTQLLRFKLGVGKNMRFHRRFLVKMFVANRAGQHYVGGIEDFVDVKASGLTEAFTTICALVWLILGVDVLVVPEMVLPSEGLATNITRVGTFISVRPLVDQQVVGLGELSVTELADEPLLGSCCSLKDVGRLRSVEPVLEEQGLVYVR